MRFKMIITKFKQSSLGFQQLNDQSNNKKIGKTALYPMAELDKLFWMTNIFFFNGRNNK